MVQDVILQKLAQRKRLREVADELGLEYAKVQRIASASSMKYVGRRMNPQQIAEVKRLRYDEGLAIRVIAARMNLPKSKIGRFVKAHHEKVVDTGGTEIKPEPLKQPKRCPEHGLVKIWPCVACAAMGRRHD